MYQNEQNYNTGVYIYPLSRFLRFLSTVEPMCIYVRIPVMLK